MTINIREKIDFDFCKFSETHTHKNFLPIEVVRLDTFFPDTLYAYVNVLTLKTVINERIKGELISDCIAPV